MGIYFQLDWQISLLRERGLAGSVKADSLYMWWTCTEIFKFWTQLNICIEDITKIKWTLVSNGYAAIRL